MAKKVKTLKPVRPNAGVAKQYRKDLDALIDDMQKSIIWWVRANYKKQYPEIAVDASPAKFLQRILNKVIGRWRSKFEEDAEKIASKFVEKSAWQTDFQIRRNLKEAGMTVKFRPTQGVKNAIEAAVNENVALIKSIGEQHLSEVNGIVMRAVSAGGKWGGVEDELVSRFGITKRRAQNIVRDQSSKATTAINRQRQIELGLFDAIWVHSSGGKTQRASHVKASQDKLKFDIREGAYIDGKWIFPGSEINCRCVSRTVLPF